MRESFWGTFIISAGVIIIGIIFFMQRVTNNGEQIYILVRETTEAAMIDAIDYDNYSKTDTEQGFKTVRINREAFVESFIRRFAQNASLANTYVIDFFDINEYPPKVSVRVKTKEGNVIFDDEVEFDITEHIDAILEIAE